MREKGMGVSITSPFYTLSTDKLLMRVLGRINDLESGERYTLSLWQEFFARILNRYRGKNVHEIGFSTFERDLQRIFKALLDLIYPGVAFKGHCILQLVDAISEEGTKMTNNRTIGSSEWSVGYSKRTQTLRKTSGTIFILEGELDLQRVLESDAMVMMTRYIGTLSHEMSHMVAQLNCCDCDACFSPLHEEGLTGHGPSWQRLAYRTECFLRQYLNLNVDLGRMDMMVIEVDAACADLPLDGRTNALILSVGLKPDEVEKEVKLERAARGASNGAQSTHTRLRRLERIYQDYYG
jgi:hypothetical protein